MRGRDNGPHFDLEQNLRLKSGRKFLNRSPQIDDHFTYGAGALDSHVPQYWDVTDTGGATVFAPSASSTGGAIIAVTGGTTDNGEEVGGKHLGWNCSTQAGTGRMVLEVRAKFVGATTATDGDYGIGFADAITYANSLPYVVSAASAFTTSVPTEFVGFWYSSIPTSGTLYSASGNLIGAINTINTTDTIQSTGIVKDSNYHVYGIELDAAGNAAYYIDDALVATKAAALTANTAMTPYIVAIAKNSHAHTATVDYIHVSASHT